MVVGHLVHTAKEGRFSGTLVWFGSIGKQQLGQIVVPISPILSGVLGNHSPESLVEILH